MKTSKELSVRLNGRPIGRLLQTTEGRMRFKYMQDANMAVSLSLPLQENAYPHKACDSYFGGLLPESSNARDAIGHQFNANPNSTFSLLKAIGMDCAGAISFEEPSAPINENAFLPIRVRPLNDKEIEKHIQELPLKPLFLGIDGLRLSLAGVQEKAAVFIHEGQVCLPLDGLPTSHILKPQTAKLPGLVQNEYLCMKTAKAMGLRAPVVEMRKAISQIYLLVQRYDREVSEKGVTRIHQEDFCQALGNRKKYQRFGGPGLKNCFDLLMNSIVPVMDRNYLMEAVLFNFLIGNADAHGKNFSLLHSGPQKTRLAPFYDLVCTRVYSNLRPDMSMKIGTSYNFRSVGLDDWQVFAQSVGFSFPAIRKMLKIQIETLPKVIASERAKIKDPLFDCEILDEIVKFVTENVKRTEKILSEQLKPEPDTNTFSGSITVSRETSSDYFVLKLVTVDQTTIAESKLKLEDVNELMRLCDQKPLKAETRTQTINIELPTIALRKYGFISI